MRNFLLAANDEGLYGPANAMMDLFRKILGPVLMVIGIAAVIYAIVLGINYAKAEDAEARKKVQGRLIGALIGAVIIIAGATLCLTLKWDKIFESFSGETLSAITAFLGR